MPLFETHFAAYVPSTLMEEGERVTEKLLRALSDSQYQRLETGLNNSPELAEQLIRALLGSDYILESCCRDPDLLFHWLLVDSPFSSLTPVKIIDAVETACSDELSQPEFDKTLRVLRRRFMTELYWRDLNGLADFNEVSQAMTAMAEVFIQQALNFHYRLLAAKHGEPIGKDSQLVQPMLVIGMGKLGGGELNVSSDVDLIFAFPEAGKTNHKMAAIDNQKFFMMLGQSLIKSLNEVTVDGFVFRVDMRLRPYGQSGALVSNFTALENYYQTQGRDWERYAAVKARVVACTQTNDLALSLASQQQATESFYNILKPFIYRKYVDYSTVESLRQLKTMIVQEVRRKGLQDDVKLGAGGIREIEFIAQSFQLIRGGRDTRLQERGLLVVLQRLEQLNNLAEDVVEGLTAAYLFLRKTEHSIQAYQDSQTQRLPHDSVGQERLAWVMGFTDWDSFFEQLEKYRHFVSATFQQVVATPESKQADEEQVPVEWQSLWKDMEPGWSQFLSAQGFSQADKVEQSLLAFQQSRNVQSLSASAREKLDRLIPQLLHVLTEQFRRANEDKFNLDETLVRLLDWLQAIVNRTSYVLLLVENPQVLQHLVTLFAASSWVAETLTKMPSLLDELLIPENLFSLPEKEVLRAELRQRLLRIDEEDVEAHMEMLRYFRLAHNLHVAACEVAGTLPLMKVSDYLTYTAEVILEQVQQLALQDLSQRHGFPEGVTAEAPGFLVVGYGKLGGIEMSYTSDLDLVFIYDANTQGMTDGKRPLDNQTYYTRLGQKMIHILNTRTLSGKLYEVDMRLRPSGNSGLLVSSLAAYSKYQQNEAWNWEHQALVRARPIAGDGALSQKFEQLRQSILCKPRELGPLKQNVIEMRNKMRDHLGSPATKTHKKPDQQGFHLKHDEGGIVDIEFMVQYAVLAWAHQQPALAKWTDNIRLLESLQLHGFIEPEQAEHLIETYKSYRKYRHRLALQQEESYLVTTGVFDEQRQQVIAMWDQMLT